MNRHGYAHLREAERRIRASMEYARWVERNKSAHCVRCGSSDSLECHHLVELRHIVGDVWKFYGDWETTFTHVCQMHDNDSCESATLCARCHGMLHPGKASAFAGEKVKTEDWCVLPRSLSVPLCPGRKEMRPGCLGLVGFQTLIGMGWHILNGHCSHRVVEFNRRRFAEVLGKLPSASFSSCLHSALEALSVLKVVDDFTMEGNGVEVHLSRRYADSILENPWFFPRSDLPSKSMSALALRWVLNMQTRPTFSIGRDKLADLLQFSTRSPSFMDRAVASACAETEWVRLESPGPVFRFRMGNRGAVPVYSLRRILPSAF